jgi:uncharacterized protein
MPSLEQAREWYDRNDPVHGYDHIVRMTAMAMRLADEVGADAEIVMAAAILHDAAGASPDRADERGAHEARSAAFARQILLEEGWPRDRIAAVEHCILAHRFRRGPEPQTLEARVVFDADKLDVVGAFGAARTMAYALQAGEPIYSPPSEQFLKDGRLAAGERHSAYHEYLFKLRRVHERMQTQPGRRLAERRRAALDAFFRQLADEAEGRG